MPLNADVSPCSTETNNPPLSKLLKGLNEAELAAVQMWVETHVEERVQLALANERAGLDKLFESMSHAIKFIPNAISARLCTHYIEPSICARIAIALEPNAAAGIANHLLPDYVVQTCQFLSAQEQADLLVLMKPKSVNAVLDYYLEYDAPALAEVTVLIAPATLAKLCKPAVLKHLH